MNNSLKKRWFDTGNNNNTISLLFPLDFDTMVISSNQTSSIIETNTVSPIPNDLHWYPFYPGICPPSYNVILQGVCAPLIIIISTVLNSLIAVVLLQKQLRSPTNILLLAIALYDTLTGLFPFPTYIYVFTFKKCDDYMPYNYGWFHRINYQVLPFIFHTCSIWVTVVLAIQRYIYVCHSEKAKQWCTVRMALKAVACVNVLALIVAIPMFVEGTFHPITVRSLKDSKKILNACLVRDYSEDPRYSTLYSVYSVLRALLINVGPCTVLVILNAILVDRMKEAKQNRDRLMRKRSQESRAQEQTSVTLMLVIVVTIFLIVEVPMALHLIISGLLKLLESDFLSGFLNFSVQLLNFAVLLSYPINFFIYCRMSRAFRDAFTELLCPSKHRSGQSGLPPSTTTRLIIKSYNNNDNYDHLELNDTNIEMKNSHIKIEHPSTVIFNQTTAEPFIPLTPSMTSLHVTHNGKKPSTDSLSKHHVLFRDDVPSSANMKFTDL
ncbi:unnamed protein product [Rotaria sordida]|uniref:G-protein coupled receptors family 1 profile domain-containing protein n=1 Tax=Rotaria sordida TaxID=392033 RepID=A0A813N5A1_9BILA|nr:unnamed protein product [Rotaria sordida]CAF0731252.1 unnamed protein product [Rotaria sordida]CAF0732745.1 unnamed protein product [Rotaria sordida]CAF0755743.1 unnamed protein product [Rotaria sordida]CAF3528354.1 unnamed protein product [Rotaria sordida]